MVLLDHTEVGEQQMFTALLADGRLSQNEVSSKENLVDRRGERSRSSSTPCRSRRRRRHPRSCCRTAAATRCTWRGATAPFAATTCAGSREPLVAETVDLVPEPGGTLTDLRFMLGEQSLVAGDSLGNVNVWFRVPRPDAATEDGYQMIAAHRLEPHQGGVVRTAMSSRDKGLLTATDSGEIWLRHMTSEQVLARLALPAGVSAAALQITPKADGIFALDTAGKAWTWDLHNPHPETTLRTIFGQVWYEGYEEPSYTWQSSSGNDDFEPKFSLVPLVFGTLKATLYSLLFAVPIALCGAIYTSQFLDTKLRTPIKSAVETMASLPSVVLGFVAALVLAPFIENWVVAVLAALALVPLGALTFGYLWQLLPRTCACDISSRLDLPLLMLVRRRWRSGWRWRSPGRSRRLLFGGDFKAWLDGAGSRHAGAGAAGLADRRDGGLARSARSASPTGRIAGWRSVPPPVAALAELGRFLGVLAVGTGLAWVAGSRARGAWGSIPAHALVGTYVQRNTLVVGFVMGFAVDAHHLHHLRGRAVERSRASAVRLARLRRHSLADRDPRDPAGRHVGHLLGRS